MTSPSGPHVRNGEFNSSNAVSDGKHIDENSEKPLSAVVDWLNSMLPHPKLSSKATEEELRVFLKNEMVFYTILYNINPGSILENQGASSGQVDGVKRFLMVMEEMGLPGFDASDFEKGSMTAVVECLLTLRDHLDSTIHDTKSPTKFGSQPKRWRLPEVKNLEGMNGVQGDQSAQIQNSLVSEERWKSVSDEKFQRVLRGPVASDSSTALSHHGGHKFHEVFQLKQGRYSDLPAAKISEMMKSNSLDNAPTQSLLSVVNGILDESIERKNGEIPQRVACLLRKVVQEIERRISTQAEHIRSQNNVIKAREEKYQSRIKVLETLAIGTSEESQIVMNQLQQIKIEKTKMEEMKKHGEQYVTKEKESNSLAISALKEELEATKKIYEQRCLQLEKEAKEDKLELDEKLKENNDLAISALKEELEVTKTIYEERCLQLEKQAKKAKLELDEKFKENNDHAISALKEDLEVTKRTYEERRLQLEKHAKEAKLVLEEKLKEVEHLLTESRSRTKELEAVSASEVRTWSKKEQSYRNFMRFQFQALKELRAASGSIKKEISNAQSSWLEEFHMLGAEVKGLADAAENYHAVLSENRRLYNEVQDLKGKIRVYCRIRPFLPGETGKQSTVEYIGEDGELVIANPSKQGKEGHRMFNFNKVFGPAASQEEVFLDTQPFIRSVLDGYNVCIFAYGQTGSGKTYTMTGPEISSKETWGVNYRALNDLFHISQNRKTTFMYEVGVQMVEIYNEQVRDLLGNGGAQKRLGIFSTSQPNGLAVPDASMHPVKSTTDVLELMKIGHMNRTVGATALNVRSSRSHSVLTVHVRGTNLETGSGFRGSLHLVDLAGSERADRSEATGERLKEAQHINKSLSALGDVIFALAQKSSHVPYRNSKLTQVLQSSLGGQAKTLMFVQLNPDLDSYSETLSTLKFAERVSGIELGASQSNKEGKDVRELINQVTSLKNTIAKKDEEIEQLQLLKDLKNKTPSVKGEKRATNSLRHVSSSPSIPCSLGGPSRKILSLTGGRGTGLTDKPASDPDNCFEYNDKHSESSSQQSLDDYRHEKEIPGQSKLAAADTGQDFPADVELMGMSRVDSEERLSDISDGGVSTGAETDGSIELTISPEDVKPAEATEKAAKAPSQMPRATQKPTQTRSPRMAPKVLPKGSTSLRKAATAHAPASSNKGSPKRFL